MDKPMHAKNAHTYELHVLSGVDAGRLWLISDQPLLLGRSEQCDIRLNDPAISRRHAEVRGAGDGVAVRDLGSANATMVNGRLVKETRLAPGELMAMGGTLLQLRKRVAAPAAPAPEQQEPIDDEEAEDTVLLHVEPESARMPAPDNGDAPRTVFEMHDMFLLMRAFSARASLDALLGQAAAEFRNRFRPGRVWAGKYLAGEDRLVVWEHEELAPADSAPLRELLRAVKTGKGRIAEWRNGGIAPRQLMAAPLRYGDEEIGAIAVDRALDAGAFAEHELRLFAAMGKCLAPFIPATERIEQLRRDLRRHGSEWDDQAPAFIGAGPAAAAFRAALRDAAASGRNVLVTGETGSGKSLAARLLHAQSARAAGPLVYLNCGALAPMAFPRELLGEFLAMRDGTPPRHGRLHEAHGGTLVLEQVDLLAPRDQAMLAPILEYGAFRAPGSAQDERVDVRIISTARGPQAIGAESQPLRPDLFHRLAVFELRVPPLRERTEDIPKLADHFLRECAALQSGGPSAFAPAALTALSSHAWPGNVAQLRNVVIRAFHHAKEALVSAADLRLESLALPPGAHAAPISLAEVEARHIQETLRQCGGHVSRAARQLGIARSTLYNKMAEYGISPR